MACDYTLSYHGEENDNDDDFMTSTSDAHCINCHFANISKLEHLQFICIH